MAEHEIHLVEKHLDENSQIITEKRYSLREFELLLMVPIETEESDFFFADVRVTDGAYSAFCTVDFQKTLKPFDKYGYALEKIMERVKNLAILHSAISRQEGRENIIKRFQALVEVQFREGLLHQIPQPFFYFIHLPAE